MNSLCSAISLSGVPCVTGEWLNNQKNGYGVTTLRDGTRLAGRYRRNVLLSSTSDVKPFLMRGGRLREQVENATKEAEHAAKLAKDRAQIAQLRCANNMSVLFGRCI